MAQSNITVSSETLRWIAGLIFTGLAAIFLLLLRVSFRVGEMKGHLDTLWDDWLYYKRKIEEESGRKFRDR